MKNEDLALSIKNGSADLIGELWNQTERFIRMKARTYAERTAWAGITAEDLTQEGFFALCNAVRGFDPERGSFLSWLAVHLHKAFHSAIEKAAGDPAAGSISLDHSTDGDGLIKTIKDPSGTIEDAEARIQNQQLRKDLDAVMKKLQAEDAETIRRIYYDGKTVREIAEANGERETDVHTRKNRAMRYMKMNARRFHLEEYIDLRTRFYRRNDFKQTHTSPVEAAVFDRERIKNGLSGTG